MTMRCGIKWPSCSSTGGLSALEICIVNAATRFVPSYSAIPYFSIHVVAFLFSRTETFEWESMRFGFFCFARDIHAATQHECEPHNTHTHFGLWMENAPRSTGIRRKIIIIKQKGGRVASTLRLPFAHSTRCKWPEMGKQKTNHKKKWQSISLHLHEFLVDKPTRMQYFFRSTFFRFSNLTFVKGTGENTSGKNIFLFSVCIALEKYKCLTSEIFFL